MSDDQQVDSVVDRLQSVVDELKGAQAKDEDEEEVPVEDQAKTLQEARIRVKEHFRRRRVANEA